MSRLWVFGVALACLSWGAAAAPAPSAMQTAVHYEGTDGDGDIVHVRLIEETECGLAWRSRIDGGSYQEITGLVKSTSPRDMAWWPFRFNFDGAATVWAGEHAGTAPFPLTGRGGIIWEPSGTLSAGDYLLYGAADSRDGRHLVEYSLAFQCDSPFEVVDETRATFAAYEAQDFRGGVGVSAKGSAVVVATNSTLPLSFDEEGLVSMGLGHCDGNVTIGLDGPAGYEEGSTECGTVEFAALAGPGDRFVASFHGYSYWGIPPINLWTLEWPVGDLR